MKNKLIIILLVAMFSLTGCTKTQKLTCQTTSEKDGNVSSSMLTIKIKDEKVINMNLNLDIKLSESQQPYKQYMLEQLKQKTKNVYTTKDGLIANFGMGSDYFKSLGLTSEVTYQELKDVLEIQGYTCKTK